MPDIERSFALPKLGSPEDADACHRWARAIMEDWEADRARLEAEVERLRDALKDIRACYPGTTAETMRRIARNALGRS